MQDPTGIPLIASIECESCDPPLSSQRGDSSTPISLDWEHLSSPGRPERGLIPFNQRSGFHEGEPGSRYNPQNVHIFDRPQEPPGSARRHRESRFSTLDDDVNTSLDVIYRKLESIPALKKQIKWSESLNEKYSELVQRQNKLLRGQDEEAALLREKLESQRRSDAIEQLEKSNVKLEEANAELKGLREQRDALQAELQVSRDEARNATEMMNEWKGKLAQLINS